MRTLGELPATFRLYAVCTACRRSAELDIRDLLRRFGPRMELVEVRRRVRCRRCGQLTGRTQIVYSVT